MAEAYKNIINNLRKGIVDQCELNSLESGIEQYRKQISEMQSHINCLQTELRDIQARKVDLPTEPIKVADMLISASAEYETSSLERAFGVGEKETYNIYDISDLRQIAEHLLVYCNNAEDK